MFIEKALQNATYFVPIKNRDCSRKKGAEVA